MSKIVNIPIDEIYDKWSKAMSLVVGDNYTIDDIETVAKTPFAKISLIGNPTDSYDLDGNEMSIQITLQVEVYTSGQKALSELYRIDNASHQALMHMGFRRSYGCRVIKNTDTLIKRGVSRYTRTFASDDLI